jgi:hypothetical protein
MGPNRALIKMVTLEQKNEIQFGARMNLSA